MTGGSRLSQRSDVETSNGKEQTQLLKRRAGTLCSVLPVAFGEGLAKTCYCMDACVLAPASGTRPTSLSRLRALWYQEASAHA
eukprot:3252516-Pleurochrysis_carterae.AAC.3